MLISTRYHFQKSCSACKYGSDLMIFIVAIDEDEIHHLDFFRIMMRCFHVHEITSNINNKDTGSGQSIGQ
jgi:hypothetical protein